MDEAFFDDRAPLLGGKEDGNDSDGEFEEAVYKDNAEDEKKGVSCWDRARLLALRIFYVLAVGFAGLTFAEMDVTVLLWVAGFIFAGTSGLTFLYSWNAESIKSLAKSEAALEENVVEMKKELEVSEELTDQTVEEAKKAEEGVGEMTALLRRVDVSMQRITKQGENMRRIQAAARRNLEKQGAIMDGVIALDEQAARQTKETLSVIAGFDRAFFMDQVRLALHEHDEDGSGSITKSEVAKFLEEIRGLAPGWKLDYKQDMKDDGELTVDELMAQAQDYANETFDKQAEERFASISAKAEELRAKRAKVKSAQQEAIAKAANPELQQSNENSKKTLEKLQTMLVKCKEGEVGGGAAAA